MMPEKMLGRLREKIAPLLVQAGLRLEQVVG
jgi:hypothetical protein